MKVSEVMSVNPACCTPFTKLQDVAKLMLDHDCGAIPVVEDEQGKRPIGVITDRDIAVRSVALGMNPLEMTADAVMSSPVETVLADDDLITVVEMLEDNQLRRAIVVDDNGAVCGIVAQADIALNADDEEVGEMVREVSEPGHDMNAA